LASAEMPKKRHNRRGTRIAKDRHAMTHCIMPSIRL
jgi:hypothetical protein